MRMLGYEMAHHGEGRWNGVAILSRVGIEDVITNFGDGPVRDSTAGAAVAVSEDDFDPFDEARMVSAVCGGVRVVSLYAPNGRVVGLAVLRGQAALVRARSGAGSTRRRSPDEPLAPRRRLQRDAGAPSDVWSEATGARRHARLRARARGARQPARVGPARTPTGRSAPSAAASRGGTTGPACSTRTRACGSTCCTRRRRSRTRAIWAEIDRQARKGPPTPSDHAPVVLDLDEPGVEFDAGWTGALERIAARTKPRP